MRYVRLAQLDSKAEETQLIKDIEGGKVSTRCAVEYVAHLQVLDSDGVDAFPSAWIRTKEEKVVIFTGRSEEPTSQGEKRILAAVELDDDGRLATLLKIVGNYDGDPRIFADHVTDAIDRYRKGRRYDV